MMAAVKFPVHPHFLSAQCGGDRPGVQTLVPWHNILLEYVTNRDFFTDTKETILRTTYHFPLLRNKQHLCVIFKAKQGAEALCSTSR